MATIAAIESVKAQEESCVLPAFDSDVAFTLGTIIRTHCQRNHTGPAVVYITHANSSQLLCFAASRPGMFPDSMHSVKRREAAVLRWGISTMRMYMQLEQSRPYNRTLQDHLKIGYDVADPSMYLYYGGGFPVRVKNVEGIVGVIVVHGLNPEDNHRMIVTSIQEYLKSLTN
ncbi:hypothetical protein L210DRAFT_3525358 [Boletus edulis BED1]|uniref:Uncharacterized protein n=1 Tax=Boletus edulis BED1 TaxID=1328754 RepID=A0AAD4C2E6_BOLED|nr:hypothetical protein L210DRAFT_3525358 [Boletus edulis BED1]